MKKIETLTPFGGISLFPSKKIVTPNVIEPGMFYYVDGLIFPELIKDNQVSAIVGCVDRNHGLAIGLRETELPWSSDYLFVDMASDLSGKEATEAIIKAAKVQGKNAEAAEWCAAYAFDGIEAGTMFMPSDEELRSIFANRQQLREAFAVLKLQGLQEDLFYWSSSEDGCYYNRGAWIVSPSDYGMNGYDAKGNCNLVRCMIEFKL